MAKMKRLIESALISELRLPEVVTVASGSTLKTVTDVMCTRRFGCLPVIRDGALVGIFSERDWLNRVLGRGVRLDATVDSVMTKNPVTVGEFDRLWGAAGLMGEYKVRHLPVVDREGRLKSMLSIRDILQYLAESFPEEFLAHPPDPDNICLRAESG